MEQFGIWNLLKTMLASDPPAATPTSPSEGTPNANQPTPQGNSPLASPKESEESATQTEGAENACAEYLLRHERLTGARKK